MSIEVRDIHKRFGEFHALKGVSLKVAAGELVALLGPSGSGKTTLLRIIAGLEFPDAGSVFLNEEEATRDSAAKRRVGFVFQHYALFRHMTVFENVAFGLRVKPRRLRLSEREIRFKVVQLLRLVQLEALADRYPAQLSGGQRQRIALARALAVEPKVLLLDEPFGALDANVRKELRRWLRRLHDDIHIASVFVTHDQEEALEVADRVAILNEGHIEQVGTPEDVYENPANPFVYKFLGSVNLFHSRSGIPRYRAGSGSVAAGKVAAAASTEGYARPYELDVQPSFTSDNQIKASICDIYGVGPTVKLELKRCDNGEFLHAEVSRIRWRELGLAAGNIVFVAPKNLRVFTKEYRA